MKTKRFFWVLLALVTVGSLLLSACGGNAAKEPEVVVDERPQPLEDGTYYERAMNGEYQGTVVTMTGPFTDKDTVKFDNSVAAFEEASGIDIQYQGSKEFESSISLRVDAGDAPDIIDFPQPSLLSTFVARGEVVDISTFLPQSSFENYNQSWWDLGTMAAPEGDIIAGVWHRFNAKSQVWYPQAEFEAAGYAIPETWDDLLALSDQIVADGDKPWCVGIESNAATGRPATDWIEEIMLRTTSLENYDLWTSGELPFSSPEVKHALEVLSALWKDEYVYGGSESIVTTFFGDAPSPMFETPPKCWLHKQDNLIVSFFPDGVETGTDYGFFYLPGIDETYGSPYLVAGDIMAMFNDRDEVRAVMEYFTKGESVKEWMAAGGALSPHLDASLDWYGEDVERSIAALVAGATSVRFDSSDIMPGEVGTGSFWIGMIDYFSGIADIDTVLAKIDASWPGRDVEVKPVGFLACQVTNAGGINDKSLNAIAWRGIQDAVEAFGIEGKYLESQQLTDYIANINSFVEEECDIIIPVGLLLADNAAAAAIAATAEANPEVSYAIVDINWLEADNIYGSGFATDQAAFLAGYLAAGMTETGIVATYGGMNIPPITKYMDGFVLGVHKYNEVYEIDVQVLGWDIETQDGLFVGNFESTDDGRTMGESLLDEGVDIIMPVAGPVGAGTLAVMEERDAGYLIGVDNDWSASHAYPNQADYILASALKNLDQFVTAQISAVFDGTFVSGNLLGNLENGYIQLVYGSVVGDLIPDELKAEIDALTVQIIAGEIATLTASE
jgi:alpha-glucoside transport system substrate-binding protein